MTVNEMLVKKYREWLTNMTEFEWKQIKYYADREHHTIPEHMFMCLEITEHDIRKEGWNSEFYRELDAMHKEKLFASNKHRQEHGHVTKYWLTKKGIKKLAAELGLQ